MYDLIDEGLLWIQHVGQNDIQKDIYSVGYKQKAGFYDFTVPLRFGPSTITIRIPVPEVVVEFEIIDKIRTAWVYAGKNRSMIPFTNVWSDRFASRTYIKIKQMKKTLGEPRHMCIGYAFRFIDQRAPLIDKINQTISFIPQYLSNNSNSDISLFSDNNNSPRSIANKVLTSCGIDYRSLTDRVCTTYQYCAYFFLLSKIGETTDDVENAYKQVTSYELTESEIVEFKGLINELRKQLKAEE